VDQAVRMNKESYSEQEAANALGITVARVQSLLDEYVFQDGLGRPAEIRLLPTDLVLLSIWHKETPTNIVRMPKRNG